MLTQNHPHQPATVDYRRTPARSSGVPPDWQVLNARRHLRFDRPRVPVLGHTQWPAPMLLGRMRPQDDYAPAQSYPRET